MTTFACRSDRALFPRAVVVVRKTSAEELEKPSHVKSRVVTVRQQHVKAHGDSPAKESAAFRHGNVYVIQPSKAAKPAADSKVVVVESYFTQLSKAKAKPLEMEKREEAPRVRRAEKGASPSALSFLMGRFWIGASCTGNCQHGGWGDR